MISFTSDFNMLYSILKLQLFNCGIGGNVTSNKHEVSEDNEVGADNVVGFTPITVWFETIVSFS